MNNLIWTVFETCLLFPAWIADKAGKWLGDAEGVESAAEPRFTDIFFNRPGMF